MKKLTTLNTKLLLAAIAAVAALAALALVEIAAPRPGPVPPESGLEAGLRLWDAPRLLPQVGFTDESGHEVGLEAFRGKVLLVNFWATWCEPCKREMPSLLRLQKRLGGPDFAVLAVSGDREGPAAVAPYVAENKLGGLTFLYDPMLAAARRLGVTGLPTTILVGRDGRELGRAEGALEWDGEEAVAAIAARIAERAGSAAP